MLSRNAGARPSRSRAGQRQRSCSRASFRGQARCWQRRRHCSAARRALCRCTARRLLGRQGRHPRHEYGGRRLCRRSGPRHRRTPMADRERCSAAGQFGDSNAARQSVPKVIALMRVLIAVHGSRIVTRVSVASSRAAGTRPSARRVRLAVASDRAALGRAAASEHAHAGPQRLFRPPLFPPRPGAPLRPPCVPAQSAPCGHWDCAPCTAAFLGSSRLALPTRAPRQVPRPRPPSTRCSSDGERPRRDSCPLRRRPRQPALADVQARRW